MDDGAGSAIVRRLGAGAGRFLLHVLHLVAKLLDLVVARVGRLAQGQPVACVIVAVARRCSALLWTSRNHDACSVANPPYTKNGVTGQASRICTLITACLHVAELRARHPLRRA